MAKLKGPLQSIIAQGTLGSILTFARMSTGSQVRFQRAQVVPTATDLQTQRGYFAEAVEKWNSLSPAEQQQWHDFVKGL